MLKFQIFLARFDRMMVARARLDERRRELQALEAEAQKRLAYDQALANRDRCAAALVEFYPSAVERLVALFNELTASNEELTRVNADRPQSCEWLDSAERKAKGQIGEPLNRSEVSVLDCSRLPPFKPGSPAWPPARFG
jgi:hypothetical protein